MFKFLFIVFFIFVLFVFLFGFSILRLLFGGLFGTRPGQNRQPTSQANDKRKSNRNRQTFDAENKKIIASDEGEYVDYEEVKD